MERCDPGWRLAVLVCANQRTPDHPRRCCGRERGLALRRWLRDRARAEGLRDAIVVHPASCMDVCGRGTTVALLGRGEREVWSVGGGDREALWARVLSAVTP